MLLKTYYKNNLQGCTNQVESWEGAWNSTSPTRSNKSLGFPSSLDGYLYGELHNRLLCQCSKPQDSFIIKTIRSQKDLQWIRNY